MRLTLRTLLAYLDKVLDPQDEEVLAEKVRTSEFAASLVQRIESGLRQSRLSAPDPRAGSGPDDPNLMAEYLDSTLPPDQVAGVERSCIESDVRLAEAAACHQVLTLVLGAPAEASPRLRERIYSVQEGGAGAASAGAAAAVTAASAGAEPQPLAAEAAEPLEPPKSVAAQLAMASAAGQPIDDVPDYLRRGGWRRLTSVVVTLVLGVAFLFLLTQALQPLAEMRPDAAAVAERDDEAAPVAPADRAATDEDGAAVPVPESELVEEDEAPVPAPDVEATVPEEPETASGEAASGEVAGRDDADAAELDADAAPRTTADAVGADAEEGSVARADAGGTAAGDGAGEADAPAAEDVDVESRVAEVPAAPPAPPEPSPRAVVGQALDTADALLVRGAGDAEWHRLVQGSEIQAGARVVNLPTFRGRLVLASGVDLTLADGTVIDPLSASELGIQQGKLLISATAAGVQLQLNVGGKTGTLGLEDLQSQAAIEVAHERPLGADPLLPGASQTVARLVAVQGDLGWTPEGGDTVELSAGQSVQMFSSPERVTEVANIPDWIGAPDDQLVSIEQTARDGLLEQLAGAEDLELALRETVYYRRAEVAALAARSLATLGITDVFFGPAGALNNEAQRNYWDAHVAALRQRLDLGPEAAAAVRQSIQRMSAAQAPILFRMLQGFSDEQLAAGADADLVEWLDHPLMSIRVLAIETLRDITGETLSYRAETENLGRRESMIKRWETRLNRDGIRHAGAASS